MRTAQLCKGYETSRIDEVAGKVMSTVFAKLPDGRIIKGTEREIDNCFDKIGCIWVFTDALPEGAQFIGNYPCPMITIK